MLTSLGAAYWTIMSKTGSRRERKLSGEARYKGCPASRRKRGAPATPRAPQKKTRAAKPAAKASPQQAIEIKRGKSQPAQRVLAAKKPKAASGAKGAPPRKPAPAAASPMLAAPPVVKTPAPPPIAPREQTSRRGARSTHGAGAPNPNGADAAAPKPATVETPPPAGAAPPAPRPAPAPPAAAPATPFSGYAGAFAQHRPVRRGRREGAGGLHEAAGERRGEGRPRRGGRGDRHYAGTRRRILRRRCAARLSRAIEPFQAIRRSLDLDAVSPQRRGDAARRCARSRRQALFRSGLAGQSLFRFHQTGLCPDHRAGRRSRAPRRRTRSAHARQGRVLFEAGDQRALALQFPRHQPRTAAHHAGRKRRESRARPAYVGRGHRGRPRPVAHPPVRRRQVQARRQSRRDARQGRLSQRTDGAHPVRALDARGLQAPAADRAAVDQQVLHPRPQSGKVVHPLGGRAGADRVRRLLGQPGRAPRRQGFRGLYARGHLRGAGRDRGGDRRDATSPRSAIASAALCSR